MWDYGAHWGMMGGGFGWLTWVLVIFLIVAAIKLVFGGARHGYGRHGCGRHDHWRGGPGGRSSSALTLLEERYARGEIQREEYLQKKGDLTGDA